MSSEIARLKEEIQLRCQAVQLCLNGYAEVSKHQTIEHKYNAFGESWQALEKLVGPESAQEIAVSAYIHAMDEHPANN